MTRFGYAVTMCFSVLAIGGLSPLSVTPRLLWNATASAPIGLFSFPA
ncbi:hypothetical protein [Azospirillum sp.]|nr:hypothetical protein [Azospirillum sp.]